MPEPPAAARSMRRYYDLTVTLEEAEPPVWRHFLLAADATFADLHAAIQAACGWWNYHLFEFTSPDGQTLAGLPDDEGWRDELVPEAGVNRLLRSSTPVCQYVYDFGDNWQLDGVDYIFRLAKRAGFVKVRKGTLSVTRRGQALGGDPVTDWHAAFAGLLQLGVLGHRYAAPNWMHPYWTKLVDEQVPGMLAFLLLEDRPMAMSELAGRLWALVEASFVLGDLSDEQYARHRDHVAADVRHVCAAFADLGALTVEGVETVTSIHGFECEQGGQVELTPLGAARVRQLVAE